MYMYRCVYIYIYIKLNCGIMRMMIVIAISDIKLSFRNEDKFRLLDQMNSFGYVLSRPLRPVRLLRVWISEVLTQADS